MSNLFATDELKKVSIQGDYFIKIPADLSVDQTDKVIDFFYKSQNGEYSIMKATIKVVTYLVKDWNFVKEEGKEVEITEENVGKLKSGLIDEIFEQIVENNSDLKNLVDRGKKKMAEKKDKKKEDMPS